MTTPTKAKTKAQLEAAYDKACAEYAKAWAALDKAGAAEAKAGAALDRAAADLTNYKKKAT